MPANPTQAAQFDLIQLQIFAKRGRRVVFASDLLYKKEE